MVAFQYKTGFSVEVTDFQSRDLCINQNGIGYLVNCYGDTQEYDGEIGWYKGEINPDLIESIKKCIENGPFLQGPEYPREMMPGQLTRSFFFQKGQLSKSYVFNADDPLPGPFEELQKKYYAAIENLRNFRWKTLRVHIAAKTRTVTFGDYLDLFITFQNTGTTKIYFPNPCCTEGGIIDFALQFAKQNVSPVELSSEHYFSIDLRQQEVLVSERKVVDSNLRTLSLEPSAELKLRCRPRIPKCIPGDYAFNLVYNSVGSEKDLENQEFIEGELHSEEKTLVIKKVTGTSTAVSEQ
jgi:hypothetical protein